MIHHVNMRHLATQLAAVGFLGLVCLSVIQYGTSHLSHSSVTFDGPHWTHEGQTLERTELVASSFMRVESHTVRTEKGEVMKGWLWVDMKDQVNILVQNRHKKYIVFRQTKYGLPTESLAVIGGMVENGESPLEAAKRELMEELGRLSNDWVFLGTYRTDVNRGGGFVSSFIAKNSYPMSAADHRKYDIDLHHDDLEKQSKVSLSLPALRHHLMQGHFQEVKWCNTIAMGLMYLSLEEVGTGSNHINERISIEASEDSLLNLTNIDTFFHGNITTN